jgi:hypothetical protein
MGVVFGPDRCLLRPGVAATEVVRELAVLNPSVLAFRFFEYPSKAQFAAPSGLVGLIRSQISKIVPVDPNWKISWNYVRHAPISADALDRMVPRSTMDPQTRLDPCEISADRVLSGWVDRKLSSLAPGNLLNFCSSCTVGASADVMHFPLLDFQCAPTDYFLKLVKAALAAMGQERGVVVASGQSFQYYGFEPLSPAEWTRFLGRALLFAPLSDPRYIAHCLVAREAVLRLSTSAEKPSRPVVRSLL